MTSIQLQSIGRSVLRREHDFALDLALFLLDITLHERVGNQLRRQNGFVRLKLETTDRLSSLPGRFRSQDTLQGRTIAFDRHRERIKFDDHSVILNTSHQSQR